MTNAQTASPLANVALGDLLSLPDGRHVTVRSKVALPAPALDVAGFVLCGEFEALLTSPAVAGTSIGVYTPTAHLPYPVDSCTTVYEGAARYWAPHLPNIVDAMGELLYRFVSIRGSATPAILLYRGQEVVVFLKAKEFGEEHVAVASMPRTASPDTRVVDRHTATVAPPMLLATTPSLYQSFTNS